MEYSDLITILDEGAGSKINRAAAIYQLIEQAPEKSRSDLLRTACEVWEDSEENGTISLENLIGEAELESLKKRYSKLVDGLLEGLLQVNPSEPLFYVQLWDILSSAILPDEKARYFALYWILIDARIPYFDLGEGMSMGNEQYKTVSRRIHMQRAHIRFAVKRSFEQKTQRASILLQELDSVSGEDRVVLMANLIGFLEHIGDIGKLLGGLTQLFTSSDS
ncbi:MAG: hypothetical protein IAE83_21060 [Anaerolinea sp.]|nr:hypothetical protein [Anaerolinea sp.]